MLFLMGVASDSDFTVQLVNFSVNFSAVSVKASAKMEEGNSNIYITFNVMFGKCYLYLIHRIDKGKLKDLVK